VVGHGGIVPSALPELERFPNAAKDRLRCRRVRLRGTQRKRIHHIVVWILNQPDAHESTRTRPKVACECDCAATCELPFRPITRDEATLHLPEHLTDRPTEWAQCRGQLILGRRGEGAWSRPGSGRRIEIQRAERMVAVSRVESWTGLP